jgi:hypothetical protein
VPAASSLSPKKKIKLKIVENFQTPKSDRHPTTIYHAIHHNFTTKNHAQNTIFLKNPQQKRPSTTKTKRPKNRRSGNRRTARF